MFLKSQNLTAIRVSWVLDVTSVAFRTSCHLWMQFTHYGVSPDQVDATMVTTTIIVVLFSTIVSRT